MGKRKIRDPEDTLYIFTDSPRSQIKCRHNILMDAEKGKNAKLIDEQS